MTLRIKCSKGTYIRSIARDLGEALNSGAHLTGLRRTRSGDFRVDEALSLENVEKIISEHAGKNVHAGELVISKVDVAAVQDGTGPLTVQEFKKLGLPTLKKHEA